KKSKSVKKSKPKAKPKPSPKPKEVAKDKSKQKVEKIPTKKKKAPPKKKKQKPKAKPSPEEDAIDSILTNLEKDSEGADAKAVTRKNSDVKGDKYSRGKNYNEDAPLSISENLYIRNQIERHWRKPAESLISQGIRVVMDIKLAQDASVTKIEIIKVFCPSGADVTCNLVKDSAIRAVYKASPFEKLQPERYNSWQTLSLTIDPNNMGQ
ncbi:TonB C-terminal domain-containing protein, partial [Rickettsiaceae bacterium]|nr:TonB C-terminal domain-containing protein [Rickettsiaceae bacterium]